MEYYVCKFLGAKVWGLNWFTTLQLCFFKKNGKMHNSYELRICVRTRFYHLCNRNVSSQTRACQLLLTHPHFLLL